VLGTAAYLAPEQARGEEAGPRADIYSLGVVAYQLLSGRLPYEASSLSELTLKQQRESPVPLDELNPRVPRELGQAVAMALAIDQESRFSNAISFGEALRNGAHGLAPLGATDETAHLGTQAATRMLPREDPTAATRMATPPPRTGVTRAARPRQLEPMPVARRAAPVAPATMAERPRNRGLRRLMVFLALAVAFTIAVAVAVIIATSTSNTVVHFRRVVGHDAQSAINSMRDLINQYTK
jgi:serine/threonine-protein kinase